jgi:hypothetical protein
MSHHALHERIAENNLRFRQANEAIVDTAIGYDLTDPPLPFLCECANKDCTELVRLTAAEYEKVRADQRHFLVAPGHEKEDEEAAVVVADHERYVVLEKVGRAARIVEDSLATKADEDGRGSRT